MKKHFTRESRAKVGAEFSADAQTSIKENKAEDVGKEREDVSVDEKNSEGKHWKATLINSHYKVKSLKKNNYLPKWPIHIKRCSLIGHH